MNLETAPTLLECDAYREQPCEVGICVLNWNAGASLVANVRLIERAVSDCRARLVIVDNASSDHSLAALREKYPLLPVIESGANLGYAAGNNLGARFLLESGCEFLIFLNPDVSVEPGTIRHLLDTLRLDVNAGCAGGVPFSANGETGSVARRRPSAFDKLVAYGPSGRIPFLRNLVGRHWMRKDELRDGCSVYAVCGACIAFRAEAFRAMEGFDENTFLYEEEFIVAERLKELGWKVVVSMGAHYLHAEGLSTDRIPQRRLLHFYASENYLLRRYYGWHPALCAAFRIYRYCEWFACAPFRVGRRILKRRSARTQ